MPTISDVQPGPTTPTLQSDTTRAVSLDLVHAGNLADDASVARDDTGITKPGRKQGYIFMPVVGLSDDEAGLVHAASASRLQDGKEPYPVIFANGADMARFNTALAEVRANDASTPKETLRAKTSFAATEPGRIPIVDDQVAGLLRTLDPTRTKLYFLLHGAPGLPGFLYFSAEDVLDCFTADQVAQKLKDAGLDPRYRHFHLLSCHGAEIPADGGPTTAEHFAKALGEAGFEDAEIAAYPGMVEFLGEPMEDGKSHKVVLVGEDQRRVRASSVRLTTTYKAVKQGTTVDSAYVPDEPLPPAAGSSDYANMRRVADKPGGIAAGGIYEDAEGVRWLVKSYANDRAAVNEHVAMQLFAEVGLRVPVTKLVSLEGAHDGGIGIASQWIDGLEPFDASNTAHRKQLQQNFALYAWLGAWDVIGRFGDNVAFKDGELVHLDGGCSLYCRATGGLKSTGFPGHVLEAQAMRGLDRTVEIDANARAVFGDMTQADLQRSAHRFGTQAGRLSKDRLRELTAPYGAISDELTDRLVARKEHLLGRDFTNGEHPIDRAVGISVEHAASDPATEVDAPPSPPASTPLEKRYAALAGLRDIATHLAGSEPPSPVHASKLLDKDLVARMTGILCRLPDASKGSAADKRAFQGVIDYIDLLTGCLRAGSLPAAAAFERLGQPLKFNGRDTSFLLATASMAGSHARTAHALGDLLGAMRRAPVDGIDSARLRHDLLRLRGGGGLWRGDKYNEFYGRAFYDGRLSKATDGRFVLAYRLARENLIPTKSESREVVSSQRADKYLRAAKRAAAIASTPAGWQALEHATPGMRDLCRDIVERNAPERLASAQARESRRLDRRLQEERRSQALSHVEGIVARTVQQAWDDAMDDARRHMRPSLFSWFFNTGAASIWNGAADALPALAPPELVRGTLEKVLQSERMIEWMGQLEGSAGSSAATDALPDFQDALRAQLEVQRDSTVQAAREQALQQVGREAERATRAAEALAMRQAAREAQDRARQEARQGVEDQQRRVLRDATAPGPDVREDISGLREHLRKQAEAREEQAARAAAERAVRERAKDLERRAEAEMERLLGEARHAPEAHPAPWRDEANRGRDADLMALADRVLAGFDWQVRNFEQWDASRPARWA